MKYFTIYNQNTGEIKSSGSSIDIESQDIPAGFLILEVKSDPFSQYVKNNIIKDIPKKPNFKCDFDFSSEVWVESPLKQKEAINFQRSALLYKSDWTQIPGGPLTPELQQQWADYRQELRDISLQSGYPFNVVWPTPPQG